MKKILNRVIVVILILATIISIPPMPVNAAVKIEDNLKWFYTNSDYVKSITIPLDYYNYQAEYDYEKDYKKYTKYYVYDNILLPNFNIKASYKVSYNKNIADVKVIKYGNNSFLAIKPLKKGATDLKISISAKGYHTYNLTTKINIVGVGNTIQTRMAPNTYFISNRNSRADLEFVPKVIEELKLKDKSLYEKVIYSAKWCIDNREYFKDKWSSNINLYMNGLFNEFMNELNVPHKNMQDYNIVLMNNEKWYMVNINYASYKSSEDIQEEIVEKTEYINYCQEEIDNGNDFYDPFEERYFYINLKEESVKELDELQRNLDDAKLGIPIDLTYTLVSPYMDETYTSYEKNLLGKEFAKEDLLIDPDKNQKLYTGKLPYFTEDKITVNLLHSYGKKIKMPINLNGIKADDIYINDNAGVYNFGDYMENDRKAVYGHAVYQESSSTLINAEASGVITDTIEVEVIAPSLDGEASYTISNIKKGEKIKAPLANAKFSDFNIKTENSKIATVSSSGVITAKSKGATRIIFESKSNKNFKLTLWIGVEKSATF